MMKELTLELEIARVVSKAMIHSVEDCVGGRGATLLPTEVASEIMALVKEHQEKESE